MSFVPERLQVAISVAISVVPAHLHCYPRPTVSTQIPRLNFYPPQKLYKAKQVIERFYGSTTPTGEMGKPRCVLTDQLATQDHHLDEGIPKYHHFVNLIPISGDVHDHITFRRTRPWPDCYDLRILDARSTKCFNEARFAIGYGCSRLAAFVTVPHNGPAYHRVSIDPDASLNFCANCLINLRPISAVKFAVDTLYRSILRVALDNNLWRYVSDYTKVRLTMEIGSYFRDYGDAINSHSCCDLAERLVGNKTDLRFGRLRTRIYQHRGITYASQLDIPKAKQWLQIARERSESSGYPEGTFNDKLWSGTMEAVAERGDMDNAEKYFRDILDSEKQGAAPQWTVGESLYHLAESESRRGHKPVADAMVYRAQKTFKELHIIPTAVLRPDCVDEFFKNRPNDRALYIAPRTAKKLKEFTPLALRVLGTIAE